MRARVSLGLILVLIIFTAKLGAQSNLLIDELLEEERVSFGKTAYLVLGAARLVLEETSVDEALDFLSRTDWKVEVKKQDAPIRLGEYAFLLMKAFDIKGGLMYGLFPGPRYACRELAYMGFIKSNALAYRTLSGEEALRILGRVLDWKGEQS